MAENGQVDDGPPLTELESLQLKSNQITDESLDSTRRMIQLCEDVSLWAILQYFGYTLLCGTQGRVLAISLVSHGVNGSLLSHSFIFCSLLLSYANI